ncbi:MAG TPA: hypothetical protein VK488_09745 [Gaiellaceae bacterium]|nr:hypothetical protein [Gaiellaceae bacterium]
MATVVGVDGRVRGLRAEKGCVAQPKADGVQMEQPAIRAPVVTHPDPARAVRFRSTFHSQ